MFARTGSIAIACVLAMALPASARAARPVSIALGEAPGVAVDAAGTAHVAYNGESDGAGQPLMYCAWPRGARNCTPRAIVSDGAGPSAQPALVQAGPAAGELTVVSQRAPIVAVRSLDGGATFAPPAPIGFGTFFDGAFGPAGGLALGYYNTLRYRTLAGPADLNAGVTLNTGYGVNTETGFAGARPVFVSGAASPGIAVSSWSGQGDVHDPAMWRGPFKIAESNDFALASGRRGLWLAYADFAHGGDEPLIVRKFSGQRFGRAHRIPAGRLGNGFANGVGFTQDATGRMVVIWNNGPRGRLEYSASRTGARWTPARVLATGLPSRVFTLQVALGPDGRGLVVWDPLGGGDVKAVRVSVRGLLKR